LGYKIAQEEKYKEQSKQQQLQQQQLLEQQSNEGWKQQEQQHQVEQDNQTLIPHNGQRTQTSSNTCPSSPDAKNKEH
jgi:hypothetical protein